MMNQIDQTKMFDRFNDIIREREQYELKILNALLKLRDRLMEDQ